MKYLVQGEINSLGSPSDQNHFEQEAMGGDFSATIATNQVLESFPKEVTKISKNRSAVNYITKRGCFLPYD